MGEEKLKTKQKWDQAYCIDISAMVTHCFLVWCDLQGWWDRKSETMAQSGCAEQVEVVEDGQHYQVHPLSWLLRNNRLETMHFVSVLRTFSYRLLLSNQEKECTW